jgi:hypothetical protein
MDLKDDCRVIRFILEIDLKLFEQRSQLSLRSLRNERQQTKLRALAIAATGVGCTDRLHSPAAV